VVNTPGHLLSGFGCDDARDRFHDNTLLQDAVTGIIWVKYQVSLGAGEMIMTKIWFDEWLWEMPAAEITHLLSDNGVFTADIFHDDSKMKNQSESFSGVGVNYQNAMAERAIQTNISMTRTFMVHVSLQWSEHGIDNLALWGLQSSMLPEDTTDFHTEPIDLLHWNCSLKPRSIIATYSTHMYGVVLSLLLTKSYNMERK